MKKVLVSLCTILLLTGCNGQNSAVTKNVITYNSNTSNISFDYPSDWKLNEDKTITITSPATDDAGTNIVITIPAENFDEYENTNKAQIESNKMSIETTTITTKNNKYSAKKYGQPDWLYYLIQVNQYYVGVGAERYLDKEQGEGLEIILDSISF